MPHNHNIFHIHGISDEKELKEIYISVAIRAFALSLISVFVPLYLLGLGYSFNSVILFLLIYYGALAAISPLSGMLSTKIGIKHVTFLGPIATIAYILLLFLAGQAYPFPIYWIALVGSVGMGLYWVPINSHFAKHSHIANSSAETSYMTIWTKIVSVVAPIIGGYVITAFGFGYIFALACIFMAVSIFPLFMSYEYKSAFKYKFTQMFSKRNLNYFGDFVFNGMLELVAEVIFPIYIFFLSRSYEITGAAASLTGLGIAASAFLIGRYSDRMGKIRTMRIGGILNVLLWIALLLFQTPILIYISSFLVGFFAYTISIPLFAFFCDRLGEHEHTEFMTFREIGLTVGRIVPLFFLLFFSFQNKFLVSFALAAVAALYFVFADLK